MQHKTTTLTGIALYNCIAGCAKPCIVAFLLLISAGLYAQSRSISLSAKNAPIKEVLSEIEQKSGYRILYNDEVVPDGLRVSVEAENVAVKDILSTMLSNTELTFIMNNEELIIITKRQYVGERAEIFGTVTDENGAPVPYANVVLLQPGDTTRLGYGAVTDEQGYYKLANVKPASYRLQVSFIGYKTQYAELIVAENSNQPIVRNFMLPADQTLLQELVVEGQRPALKAENGKLIYHLPVLLKNKSVTNAYDALKELPGVMEQGERLSLIGTTGMTILINGNKTSMTYEQLATMLRSIPLSRVEDVEIMYSTPPQYNIRGAAINVKLKQTVDEELQNTRQGEVAGQYAQMTYGVGEGRANMLYLGKNSIVDASYLYRNGRNYNEEKLMGDHTLNDKVYHVNQFGSGTRKGDSHNARLALQHTLPNKDQAEISYTGIFSNTRSDRTAVTDIEGASSNSAASLSGPSSTHNFKADYASHTGLKMGGDYTLHNDRSDYLLKITPSESASETQKLSYHSEQKIHRMTFYANQSHPLKNDWGVNYGFNYSGAKTRNRSDAEQDGSDFENASFDTRQREDIWNFFAGITKSFSQKLSAQASIAAEYYKATETRNRQTNTLWNDVAWFPALNVSYQPSSDHIFQFALSSDKLYPSYWSLNPSIFYFSSYGVTYGNPHLRPQRNYGVSLTYIHKRKYVIRPYLNHIPDYFVQLPYQSPEKLQQEFMEQNFTFRQNIGLLGVVPFNIGKRISSRVTANIMYMREKDDAFFDLSFDRKTVLGILQMNHDIILSNKPDLRMNVSGYVTTPTAIQGIFDLGASGNLAGSLTWTFCRDKARLILKGEDLLNTRLPVATIDFKGQKSRLDTFQDKRMVSLSFVYRFGGYKEKEQKEVDTSRFGTR